MLDLEGLRAFSQIVDYDYSGSNGQYKVSSTLSETNLVMRYKSIFQFADNNTLKYQSMRLEKESEDLIKEVLNKAKGAYDDVSNESSISAKLIRDSDDVQLMGTSIYSPKRTAYYTRIMTYKLG
tara:strand:+ start:3247 stop:3618 length:372 start_codon:yes stop_codon:yes gene_type:complete